MSDRRVVRRSAASLPVILLLVATFGAAYAVPAAQTPAKKALAVDDYTKWKSINAPELSGDGKWVTYGISLTNTVAAESKPVLHLVNLETNQHVEVADASGGNFSADSKWIAYTVDPSAGGRGGRGGRAGGATPPATPPATTPPAPPAPPAPGTDAQAPAQGRGAAATPPAPPRRVELRNLATGAVKSWQDIQSFQFSPTSSHLMLRRRAPQGAGGAAGRAGGEGTAPGGGAAALTTPETPAGPRGVDVIVHDLTSSRDQLLGSVADSAFNKSGVALAYTVDAAVKDANGLFVLELAQGRVIPLENDAKLYNRLTWNEDGTSLAVLKGLDVEKMRERENVLVVYADVIKALGTNAPLKATVLEPAKADGFPKGWVLSDRAAVSWSDDNQRVYFGAKPQVPVAEARRRSTDEVADVDVWNTTDERIQSQQMIRAEADRNFTFREGFDIASGRFIKLTDETMREIDIALTGTWAVGRDTRGYIHDYKRPAADIYRVNTATGERTLLYKNFATGQGLLGLTPNGKQFLFWKDNRLNVHDLDAGAAKILGGPTPPSFVDMEFDRPGPRPSYGIAGYTRDGSAAIAQQRYDLWLVPLDGSAAKNLTNGFGTKNEVRLRPARLAPLDPMADFGPGGTAAERQVVDVTKPITLTAYGEYTKKSGFFELANGQLREIVFEDASFSTPARAAKADTFHFTRQTFTEFPDLRISGPDFKSAKKITDANPQQSEYMWGKRILFDFKNKDGVRLQGILAIPDDYKPGEKRPMIVNFYEKNSQNLHRYSAPSYLTGMGSSPIQAVSEGYLTMLPDIHFRTGSSHSDMLECVEAAVKKVIEMGYVDPKRIGLNGHSYGGEGAAFIGTRSKMFAAVGMGAGVTDLFSDFNQSWGWSYQVTGGSGANGSDYYMFGQGRWGFAPWDNPEVYHFESALTHVRETVAPFLIMHGTADPTVSFAEGMNFYNALRFNNKKAVMLAYPGEGHGLRGLANRRDLTVRFFEFFNHYLKGAPAPKWLVDGVAYLEKGKGG